MVNLNIWLAILRYEASLEGNRLRISGRWYLCLETLLSYSRGGITDRNNLFFGQDVAERER
jgi:hypothetical protein